MTSRDPSDEDPKDTAKEPEASVGDPSKGEAGTKPEVESEADSEHEPAPAPAPDTAAESAEEPPAAPDPETDPDPDPAVEPPPPRVMAWLAPVLVGALGLVMLVPGLWSFGLWEPPDSWQVTLQRNTTEDGSIRRRKKGRFDRPRSELRVAEEARRAVVSSKERAARAAPEAKPVGNAKGKLTRAKDERLPRRAPLDRVLTSLSFRIFGVSEGAGRLPFALTGVLCLLGLFFLLRRFFGTWTGLLGAVVLLGLPAFLLHSRQLTSDITTQLTGLLAVGGLGLACAPLPDPRRLVWLVPGVLGLAFGFFARGAVIGVLLPVATVLVAVALSHRLFGAPARRASGAPAPAGPVPGASASAPDTLRVGFWVQAGVLALLVLVLTITTAVLLATLNPPSYNAFFGETPIVATKVMSYHGVKTPDHQLAVFDVMIKQVGFAAFPWIALVPLGLAFLLSPRGSAPRTAWAAPALDDAPARLARYGRLLLVSWVVMALLVGTYWLLRFGDLEYPALPALAGVVAVLLVGVARQTPGRLWMLGLAAAVVILVILVRDLVEFPEALVSSHINYQLRFPAEASYKRFLYWFVLAPFGLLCLALLVGRGPESPVRWPATLRDWFAGSQLGIGRWFGLHLDAPGESPRDASARLTPQGILSGLLTVALLAAAGGGAAWALMPRPVPGIVVLSVFAAPVLLPLAPYFLATAVDLALFPFEVAWQLMTGRFWRGELFLWSRDEVRGVAALAEGYFTVRPVFLVLMAPSAIVVALTYLVRLLGRAILLLAMLVLLAPITAFSLYRSRIAPPGADARLPRMGAVTVGVLAAVPLLLSGYLGWCLIPRLSEHYSYKAIIDTYNHSHNRERPEPLALFKVRSRSPVFYTKGPLVRETELQQRYPRGRGDSTLVQYLQNGWTDRQGRRFDRVYAIVPAGELGKLDRDAHAKDPPVSFYVLDARNSFYVLLSNRLGKKRVGRRLVAERDHNPLRRLIMSERPALRCQRGDNAHCVPLSVRIAERKGASEPSLELIGARFPKGVAPGSKFEVTLHFKVLKRVQGKYKVFLHIDGAGNRILGDHDPVGGKYETSLWLPGRFVVDRYTIPGSASSTVSTPTGWYTVYAGLFQGDRRMVVLSGPQDGDNRIRLGRLQVGRKIGCGCGGR